MKNKLRSILLIMVFALAFFLRFYKLGQVPYGFYQDESAIGYNAYSILKTGRDEHGQFLPVYFKSFGDYKLPIYIYATSLSIKIFGINEFAVRLPSALFGFLTVVIFYFLVAKITENKNLALLSAMLLTINPWSLHYNRATFEVSLSLFFYLLGVWFLPKKFTLGTIFFLLNLYTYNLTRLLSPLLYLITLFYMKSSIKRIKPVEFLTTAIISILLLIPFMLSLSNSGGISSASGTLIWSSATIQSQLLEFRSYLISLPPFISKLFFNMPVLTTWQFLNNLVNYLSPSFFFVSGSTHGNHGIGNVGLFYLFEFPTIILGIYLTFKQTWGKFLLSWSAAVIAVASLTRDIPHATRSFFLLFPLIIFSAVGLSTIYSWVARLKFPFQQKLIYTIIVSLISYNLIYYFTSYYIRFPIAYAKAWRSADRDLSLFLTEHDSEYQKIIIDPESGFIYTSFLFYNQFDPLYFQNSAKWSPDDSEGFSNVTSFGKYEFRSIDWSKDYGDPNVLLITSPNLKPIDIPSLAIFSYPQKPVVIALKQTIANYPTQEVAYVAVAK